MDVSPPAATASHAIVVGGSMAGLLAARVLSDHFDRVTLIERDRLVDDPVDRRGVPQARHAHVLLLRGLEILTEFFPDLPGALEEAGAVDIDVGADLRWHHFGGYKTRFPAGLGGRVVGRPFLEWLVRRRVLARANVIRRDATVVRALVATADRSRVTGVQVQRGDLEEAAEVLSAELVVDATGRGSRLPAWLDALGYGRPAQSEVTVDLGYASRIYHRTEGDLPDAKAAVTLPTPPHQTRGGVLFPLEGSRWMATLVGILGDHPPVDEPGFVDFARTLPAPDIYRAIRRAAPAGPAVPHRLPSSLRRHYERMTAFPEGLLVVGDAICSFNPVYGQGMTVSAMEARVLDEELRRGGGATRGLAPRFFRRVAAIVDVAWGAAVGEDSRYPGVTGPRPRGTSLVNWYTERVHRASMHDPQVCLAFYQVLHMVRPPSNLMRPDIVLRSLRGGRRSPQPDAWQALEEAAEIDPPPA